MVKQRLLTGIMAATLAISGICPVSYAAETAEPAGEESTIQEAEEVTAIDKGTISTYDDSKLMWTLYSDGNLVISGDDGAYIEEVYKDSSYKPTIDISKESSSKVKKITSNTLVYLDHCSILNLTGMENLEEINLPFFVSSNTNHTILAYSSSLKKINMPKAHIDTDNYYNKRSSLHVTGATFYKGYGLLGDISSLEYICFSNEATYDTNYWDYTAMLTNKDNGYCWVDSNGDEVERASLQFSDYTGLVYHVDGKSLNTTKYPISVGKKKYNINYDINRYEYSEAGSYYYVDGKVVLYDPKRESLYTGGVRVEGFTVRRKSETYTIGTDLTLEPQVIDGYTLVTSHNNVIKPEDYGDRTVTFEYVSNDTLKMLESTTEEPTTEEPTTEEPTTEEPTTGEPTTEEPTTEEPTTEEPTTEEPIIEEPDKPVVTPTYKLSYNANGGTVSKTSKTLKENAKYGTLPTAKKSGYTFLGWYTAKSGGTKVSALTKMTGKNKTIYAHWKKITVKQEQIKSAERAKNKLSATVRYARDYNADGYKIQYSTSPTFSKAVTRYVTGNKTTSYKITNLNKSKTYYVRVAAYKYDSAGKKVYGKNSSRKTIK